MRRTKNLWTLPALGGLAALLFLLAGAGEARAQAGPAAPPPPAYSPAWGAGLLTLGLGGGLFALGAAELPQDRAGATVVPLVLGPLAALAVTVAIVDLATHGRLSAPRRGDRVSLSTGSLTVRF